MIKDFISALLYGWNAFRYELADRRYMRKGGCPDFLPNKKTPF